VIIDTPYCIQTFFILVLSVYFFMYTIKKYIERNIILLGSVFLLNLVSLFGQGQSEFLGKWEGQEDLSSETLDYENRDISLVISEGGNREGFYVFQSSCGFLFNEDLNWAFHYFRFDKENNNIIFLRRFVTPVGVLGYEELVYDLILWSEDYFVAQYISENLETSNQLRMNINYLDLHYPTPTNYSLHQNFPNPFNPRTSIKISSDKLSHGALKIFDVYGRNIVTLINGLLLPGEQVVTWDGRNHSGQLVASGTYIYSLYIDDKLIGSQRMIYIK